jgi:hypothetical protein
MVSIPDEMLMAYADGELTDAERDALENILFQDPVLRDRLEPFVETRLKLSYAFDHMLHEPVPDRLVAAISLAAAKPQPAEEVVRTSWYANIRETFANAFTSTFPYGMSPLVAASAAALFVIGGAAGWIGGRVFEAPGLIAVTDQGLVASGSLARALETLPSGVASATGSGATHGSVTPVLSFRSRNDGFCREYRVKGAASAPDFAGLACRGSDGTWRLALHTETPKAEGDFGSYQTATSASVPAVDALTEGLISGDAFGRDDEAAILARGWQPPATPGGQN